MLAVIRANLGNTPETVWSDTVVRNLFAYFGVRNLFGADMRYYLFEPIAYTDPRPGKDHDSARQALVEEALNEVTRRFDPDWDLFDAAILLFTGQIDLFGGGSYAVKTRPGSDRKYITATVLDDFAPVFRLVQAVGYPFGYDDEVGFWLSQDYLSPYSSISEQLKPDSDTRRRAEGTRLTTMPPAA